MPSSADIVGFSRESAGAVGVPATRIGFSTDSIVRCVRPHRLGKVPTMERRPPISIDDGDDAVSGRARPFPDVRPYTADAAALALNTRSQGR